jgi:hypothetical protein
VNGYLEPTEGPIENNPSSLIPSDLSFNLYQPNPMAATHLYELIESTLLPLLPRPYRRADGRLTTSERERLEQYFEITSTLAHKLSDSEHASSAENELQQMKLQRLLRIRDLATFLYNNITEAEREKIATSSRQADAAEEPHDDATATKAFSKIISIFSDRIEKERGGSYRIPDGAPLDIFSFFDQWQEDVEACEPLYMLRASE